MQLSERRAKFVDEYILDHNGSRAARIAGYAVSGARVTAHRLLTDANVKAAIALKKQDLACQYELNKNSVVHELLLAVEVAKNKLDAGNMIRAWCEVAKLLGFYESEATNVVTFTENEALRTKFESMSDEDLEAIMRRKNK